MSTTLPFNLRDFASDDGGSEGYGGDSSMRGRNTGGRSAGRPSRAIHIPPDIVEGVQGRDVESFTELARLAYNPLLRFARTILGLEDEAQDVVQEVFVTIWDKPDKWRPSGEPMAYLFSSTRNCALNFIRSREREAARAGKALEIIGANGDSGEISEVYEADQSDLIIQAEEDGIRAEAVARVLATLTERQRTAYDLRYRRGLTAAQIAGVLSITTKSAEQLISRVTHTVINKLKSEISD